MTKEQTDKYLDSLRTALYRTEAITQAISDEIIHRDETHGDVLPDDVDCTALADSATDYVRRTISILDEIEQVIFEESKQAEAGAGN